MQGGSYTLNGSIDMIADQGQGGSYALNPSGTPLSGESSSGGTFVLFPTPYSKPADPVVAQVINTVSRVTYGQGPLNVPYVISATASPTSPTNGGVNSTRRRGGVSNGGANTGGGEGYYDSNGTFVPTAPGSKYTYPDTVNFGKGTSTVPKVIKNGAQKLSFKMFSFLFILLLVILLIRRWYKKIQQG